MTLMGSLYLGLKLIWALIGVLRVRTLFKMVRQFGVSTTYPFSSYS